MKNNKFRDELNVKIFTQWPKWVETESASDNAESTSGEVETKTRFSGVIKVYVPIHLQLNCQNQDYQIKMPLTG